MPHQRGAVLRGGGSQRAHHGLRGRRQVYGAGGGGAAHCWIGTARVDRTRPFAGSCYTGVRPGAHFMS